MSSYCKIVNPSQLVVKFLQNFLDLRVWPIGSPYNLRAFGSVNQPLEFPQPIEVKTILCSYRNLHVNTLPSRFSLGYFNFWSEICRILDQAVGGHLEFLRFVCRLQAHEPSLAKSMCNSTTLFLAAQPYLSGPTSSCQTMGKPMEIIVIVPQCVRTKLRKCQPILNLHGPS